MLFVIALLSVPTHGARVFEDIFIRSRKLIVLFSSNSPKGWPKTIDFSEFGFALGGFYIRWRRLHFIRQKVHQKRFGFAVFRTFNNAVSVERFTRFLVLIFHIRRQRTLQYYVSENIFYTNCLRVRSRLSFVVERVVLPQWLTRSVRVSINNVKNKHVGIVLIVKAAGSCRRAHVSKRIIVNIF